MAITVTTNYLGPYLGIFSVVATADADTDAVITHNMGGQAKITMIPMNQAVAALSLWALQSETNNTATFRKSVAVGSGDANQQLRVTVENYTARGKVP